MTERKYGHRGYQDGDREPREKAKSRPAPRATGAFDPEKGPRGRGLGAPTATVFRCAACGGKQQVAGEVAAGAVCAGCGRDLHTCSNCAYFDTSTRNECRKGVEPRINKKSTRNECLEFAPKVTQEFSQDETRAPDDPRAAFDALFKF